MTPSTPPGDWQVVEEKYAYAASWAPPDHEPDPEFVAALARLREREAQLERERDDYCKTAQDHFAFAAREQVRAEAAEVEVQKWIYLEHKMMERATEAEEQLETAEARVKELEAALREIAEWSGSQPRVDRIARRALAHEEEA